jgi:phospholipase C
VDHAPYDTTSIMRFLIRRFELPVSPGIAARDEAFKANGLRHPGDLTHALDFNQK